MSFEVLKGFWARRFKLDAPLSPDCLVVAPMQMLVELAIERQQALPALIC